MLLVAMNYQHMSEDSSVTTDGDIEGSPGPRTGTAILPESTAAAPVPPTVTPSSPPADTASSPPADTASAPVSAQPSLTNTAETAPALRDNGTADEAQPAVIAVRTSATLSLQANSNGSPGSGNGLISNVMTSQQAMKRRKSSYETTEKDSAGTPLSSATNLKDFTCPAGDRYTVHESKLEQFRSFVRRYIDHIIFRAFTIILIVIDLSIVVASVVKTQQDPVPAEELKRLDFVALVFSSYFMIEVGLRIFAQRPKIFFRQLLEIIDAIVVLVSFAVVLVDIAIDESSTTSYIGLVSGLRLVRLVRFGMLLRVIITQRMYLVRATRLLVSENKRRYQKDGFDLDLCYITDRMIAMSFPSQGLMSIYRNPIEEVSRFFNTKHLGKYRIYNCCSERTYDADKYFNNSMVRIMIDDHNVPSLQQMLDFVHDVEQWLNADRSNVIAIHCKGGKGRTGTMVGIWLLYSKTFEKADDALEYFGSRRTDLSVDSKFQGVETPSQSRYVNYYQRMLTQNNGNIPAEVSVKPIKVSVSGLRGIGDGDGRDLIVQFVVGGDLVYEAKFGSNTNCTTVFDRETSTIAATLNNAPNLTGDVKVRFEATSNIPCAYDDCPWFFWFNTTFIDKNELSLSREDLDNPHQKKTWKLYKSDFRVTLTFDDAV